MDEYEATPEIRWYLHDVDAGSGGFTLQQKWVKRDVYKRIYEDFEWRDVPLIKANDPNPS